MQIALGFASCNYDSLECKLHSALPRAIICILNCVIRAIYPKLHTYLCYYIYVLHNQV